MLVGLGPHARRIYLHYLRQHGYGPRLVVELVTKREELSAWLLEQGLSLEVCWVEPNADENDLDPATCQALDTAIESMGITHAINSSATGAHKAYLRYLMARGISVLTDKPITAPNHVITQPQMAARIEEDYRELMAQYAEARQRGVRVEVQCQRRYHPAYIHLREIVRGLVHEFRVPMTHVDVYHCDGMWNMPDEFLSRENHSYKYGHGKLFHSGYHFIDLVAWLLSAAPGLPRHKIPTSAELYAAATRPSDSLSVIDQDDYVRLVRGIHYADAFAARDRGGFDQMGELDFHGVIQLKNGPRVLTTCTLNLLQSGFSRRSWPELPFDTYKSNGRVRHERISIQVGPLANIQVHSYQAREVKEKDFDNRVGSLEHFDIYVFRNVDLVGGEPVQHLTLRDLTGKATSDGRFIGHNEEAKKRCFTQFLAGGPALSDLEDHALGIRILSNAYKALSHRYRGEGATVTFDL
jgi:predicted dehydrogenase